MNLPTSKNLDLNTKRVFIRLDLDVNLSDGKVTSDNRLEFALPTIQHCLEGNAAKIILAGHRGRPEGVFKEMLSTTPLKDYFSDKLSVPVKTIPFKPFLEDFESLYDYVNGHSSRVFILENLRFWTGEKENSEDFAKTLSGFADAYINESFATAHRKHASVSALPNLLKSQSKQVAFGFRFASEIENLSKVKSETSSPKTIIVSGVKKDKLDHLENLKKIFDIVLIAGRLPEYLPEDYQDPKVIVAKLIQDKSDITLNSIETFQKVIKSAKTITLSGPLGKFEEEGHSQGTESIFKEIAKNTDAFKLAGGGDTEAALEKFGLLDDFNWVSTGGGAMLEYLSNSTLPALEVVS